MGEMGGGDGKKVVVLGQWVLEVENELEWVLEVKNGPKCEQDVKNGSKWR